MLMLASTCLVAAAKPKPNIVMITTDDLGWGNVGWHHTDEPFVVADTPHTTKLIKEEGVELDRHYAHSVCSPSRTSFHSGRLPPHVNLENVGPRFRDPTD